MFAKRARMSMCAGGRVEQQTNRRTALRGQGHLLGGLDVLELVVVRAGRLLDHLFARDV